MLLERGAAIDARDVDDKTPLHFAAQYGRTQVAQLLLEHGADANARTKSGHTPSQLGLRRGRREIVKLLSAYVAKSVKQ
jgi:ankyrin repeat protein